MIWWDWDKSNCNLGVCKFGSENKYCDVCDHWHHFFDKATLLNALCQVKYLMKMLKELETENAELTLALDLSEMKRAEFDPGLIIMDELRVRGWTRDDLSKRSGVPSQKIMELLLGKQEMTKEIAASFGTAFDVPAELFINLWRNKKED